jgi:hypothetical protein
MSYPIGHAMTWQGDEYTITSEPYILYGGVWQDAARESDGKTITVPEPESKNRQDLRLLNAYRSEQEAFARLHRRAQP